MKGRLIASGELVRDFARQHDNNVKLPVRCGNATKAGVHIRPFFAYAEQVFNPDAHLPRPNRIVIYLGACMIAGMRLARERQVNVRVIPTGVAIQESVDLAHEIFNRVFRRVPEELLRK